MFLPAIAQVLAAIAGQFIFGNNAIAGSLFIALMLTVCCFFIKKQRQKVLDGATAKEKREHVYEVAVPVMLALATPLIVMGAEVAVCHWEVSQGKGEHRLTIQGTYTFLYAGVLRGHGKSRESPPEQ